MKRLRLDILCHLLKICRLLRMRGTRHAWGLNIDYRTHKQGLGRYSIFIHGLKRHWTMVVHLTISGKEIA